MEGVLIVNLKVGTISQTAVTTWIETRKNHSEKILLIFTWVK